MEAPARCTSASTSANDRGSGASGSQVRSSGERPARRTSRMTRCPPVVRNAAQGGADQPRGAGDRDGQRVWPESPQGALSVQVADQLAMAVAEHLVEQRPRDRGLDHVGQPGAATGRRRRTRGGGARATEAKPACRRRDGVGRTPRAGPPSAPRRAGGARRGRRATTSLPARRAPAARAASGDRIAPGLACHAKTSSIGASMMFEARRPTMAPLSPGIRTPQTLAPNREGRQAGEIRGAGPLHRRPACRRFAACGPAGRGWTIHPSGGASHVHTGHRSAR